MTEVGPSASKLKISKDASERLQFLSNRLGLRRNIICRLAVGKSLTNADSVAKLEVEDDQGSEFNRYTLTGEFDDVYRAVLAQHEGRRVNDKEYLLVYLRNHIERGTDMLFDEYQRINSPTEFIIRLADQGQL